MIVPRPLPGYYTYALPDELASTVAEGSRVVVPFGSKRYHTAIVHRLHHEPPALAGLKEVAAVLDDRPTVLPDQLKFWDWVADYYLCTPGDVYKAAMPAGLRVESETRVRRNPDFTGRLTRAEQAVFDLLKEDSDTGTADLERHFRRSNILPIVNALLAKEAVLVHEQLRRRYKPKAQTYVRLPDSYLGEGALHEVLDRLSRQARRQHDLLTRFLELNLDADGQPRPGGMLKSELLARASASSAILKALTDKGILQTYEQTADTAAEGPDAPPPLSLSALHPLSPHQQQAYDDILKGFGEKNVCLLHGITASGKTEIYLRLMAEVVQRGGQVLYLLPEIALTKQITERLRRVFGPRLGVYHSKYTDAERSEMWQRQLSDMRSYDVVLGVRSSVFLPFKRLQLVIVDEEHENTYKQQDPAPRYNARNVAIVLASLFGAKTLLGSATPSIESYFNAREGKYALARLTERYSEVSLPIVEPADLKELRRKKMMRGLFSPTLLGHMHQALERKEQVILFQNRRGYAPMVECTTCGWVPRCINCDVSLSYHRTTGMLTCHYCGHTTVPPRACPACQGTELRHRGFGTERMEDEIKAIFPDARVARMDLDSTRSRSSYEQILNDFESGQTDILVGTQMVSKGLDFDRVSVVGILDADLMLNIPDFRSYERAFQLMAQVAGRAGRREKQGRVVLQTRDVANPIVAQVQANDYEAMVKSQLVEREMFRYPPYYRLIYVYLKHRDESTVDLAAQTMAARLRDIFGRRVLGPDRPAVSRVQTLFVRKIVLKIELRASMSRARDLLRGVQDEMHQAEQSRAVMIYYDVDPM